jgi:type IV pilus assembly protein PilN
MAHINLLPWREELRKKRQRDFGVYTALGVVASLLAVAYVHTLINGMIEHQETRNNFLRQQIAVLDRTIREIRELEKMKNNLLARMDVIQELQGSRPEIVHLFDELVETLPEGVYLTQLQQFGRDLSLTGRAESNARVSSYMRNIDASEWIGNANLKYIQSEEDVQNEMSHFELKASQIAAATEEPKEDTE